MLITGIQTQGDPDEAAWVVQFRVAYSRDCEAYTSEQTVSVNIRTMSKSITFPWTSPQSTYAFKAYCQKYQNRTEQNMN